MSASAAQETIWLQAEDGLPLAVRWWRHPGPPVVICPGRAEAAVKYDGVASRLMDLGYAPWILDWRGQGASGRERGGRGWVASFEDYLSDLRLVLARVDEVHHRPPALLGHSMGGHLAVRAATRHPLAALCLFSPMVDLHLPLPRRFARALLRSLAAGPLGDRRLGRDRWADRFEGNGLTRDKQRFERYRSLLRETPQLDTGPPTLRWLREALVSIDAMWAELPAVTAPTVIFGALEDPVVPAAAMDKCAARLPRGRYVPLRGRHELLQELPDVRRAVWAELGEFLAKHLQK